MAPHAFGQNPKEQQFFLRRLSLCRWLQQMVVVVILVRRRLVKICVNLACWEKVIDSEKLARAQRISQEPLSRGFQQASSPPHHPHLHLHLQDDLWSENLFLCSSRFLSISLSLSPWETKTKTKGKHKDRDNNLKGDVLSEKFILTPSSSWLLPPLSLSLSEAEVEAAENWNTIRLLSSSSKELNYQVFCQKEFQNQIQSLKTWHTTSLCTLEKDCFFVPRSLSLPSLWRRDGLWARGWERRRLDLSLVLTCSVTSAPPSLPVLVVH